MRDCIELRWARSPDTSAEPDRLQWREVRAITQNEWQDVPVEVVTPPAPTYPPDPIRAWHQEARGLPQESRGSTQGPSTVVLVKQAHELLKRNGWVVDTRSPHPDARWRHPEFNAHIGFGTAEALTVIEVEGQSANSILRHWYPRK